MRISQLEYISVGSADVVTNLDGASPVAVPWDTAGAGGMGIFEHDPVTNNPRITAKADCEVRLQAIIAITSPTSGISPVMRFRLNGGAYLDGRSTLGHRSSSGSAGLWLFGIAELVADDYLEIVAIREGSSGTVNLIAGESLWLMERI